MKRKFADLIIDNTLLSTRVSLMIIPCGQYRQYWGGKIGLKLILKL
jgi:hypothetical protein